MEQSRSPSISAGNGIDGHQVVTRYSSVAVTLHWLIAALLMLNIVLAWSRGYIARDQVGALMAFHMSTGIVILLLSLLRLIWRLAHPARRLTLLACPTGSARSPKQHRSGSTWS